MWAPHIEEVTISTAVLGRADLGDYIHDGTDSGPSFWELSARKIDPSFKNFFID